MVLELQHQSQVWSLSSLILSYLVIGNHNNIFLLATMEISNLIECVFLSLSPSLSLIFLRETSHVMIFIFGCRFSFFFLAHFSTRFDKASTQSYGGNGRGAVNDPGPRKIINYF